MGAKSGRSDQWEIQVDLESDCFCRQCNGGKEEPSAETAVRRARADGCPEQGSVHGPNVLAGSK
jgi:hypothetical protein